jgi:Holliday junction DNA helicase RuvA
MVENLEGTIFQKTAQKIVLMVGGIGFGVHIPASTYKNLPNEGEWCRLWTVLLVRENDFTLYGFSTPEEREFFLILYSVKNIGGKTALDILSNVAPDRFAASIVGEDIASLVAIPGIGKKTAERLIFELKEKITKLKVVSEESGVSVLLAGGIAEEAVNGLIFLGCKLPVAQKAVAKAIDVLGEKTSVELLIKEALKHR